MFSCLAIHPFFFRKYSIKMINQMRPGPRAALEKMSGQYTTFYMQMGTNLVSFLEHIPATDLEEKPKPIFS